MVPELKSSSNTSLIEYLCKISINYNFINSVLKLLTEELHTEFYEWMNLFKDLTTSQLWYIVKYHIEDISVGKLSYLSSEPYQILNHIVHKSFEGQKLIDKTSSIWKYKSIQIYMLLLSLFSSDPSYTINQRYLNYENSSPILPFWNSLRLKINNSTHFHQ